jgi:hypothetical protein
MGYLEKLTNSRDGFILYCSCGEYIRQSDPQDFSGGKQVVIDTDAAECLKCTEVREAQQLLGRLGLPKGETIGK